MCSSDLGEGGPEVAEREYPAQRIGDKGRWQHERGGALREKRIQTSVDEAHIVAERQPAHHLRDLSHLEAFGDVLALVQQRPVGIEHALGGSRGAGGVLDEGRVIATRRPWLVAACGGGQDAVPTHQMRSRTVWAGWDLAALTMYSKKFAALDRNGYIGDYCSVKSGFSFKSSWWTTTCVKVIKIGSINQDNLNLLECSYVDEDKIDAVDRKSVV